MFINSYDDNKERLFICSVIIGKILYINDGTKIFFQLHLFVYQKDPDISLAESWIGQLRIIGYVVIIWLTIKTIFPLFNNELFVRKDVLNK
jgi:uncharacterized membrane-anchored protein